MPKQAKDKTRLWLTYPPRLVQRPVIYELGHKFAVVTDILQASVTDDVGILSLELEGEPAEIKRAIRWLHRMGVEVEAADVRVTKSLHHSRPRRRGKSHA